MVDIVRASAVCQAAESPSLPVGVAMGNSALKPIKRRGKMGGDSTFGEAVGYAL